MKSLLTCLGLCLMVLWADAARAEVSAERQAQTQQVFDRLVAVSTPPAGIPWPPRFEIVEKNDINAYAVIRKKDDGTLDPVVVCFSGLLDKVIEGDADRLAYVLGHELAHHTLGHTKEKPARTEFLRVTFTRGQELAADRGGAELALRAGYSLRGGLSALHKMSDLGLNYSSFEGLSTDHPSMLDRIAQLDHDQEALWRSMSSFDNGVYFLLVQNYSLAERAFRQVTKEFPKAYEAWADLGYAQLMQYADALDSRDLGHFDVGQIAAGGFYRRPKSLEGKARGVNLALWLEATHSLGEALKLKPDLALAKANLGIAFLLRPAGKDPAQAVALLEEALKLAKQDDNIDPVSRLAVELNLAVAYDASGNGAKAAATMARVETAMKAPKPPGSGALDNALAYNRALLLTRAPDTQRTQLAIKELERYLQQTGPALAWWQLAYQRYSGLCKQSGVAAKAETALLAQSGEVRMRPVAGLAMGMSEVALGQSVAEARRVMGKPASEGVAVPGSRLVELDYPAMGVKVLAGEEVLAIILAGENAPGLPVRAMGLGAKSFELKPGMTSAELDRRMGDADYDFRQLTDPETNYRFYNDLGVAVLVKNGKVLEVVISQIPKQSQRM
jgi:tetratricopeptide (TPR) repeat protein